MTNVGYEPRYDIQRVPDFRADLLLGKAGEQVAEDIRYGLQHGSVEVKTDMQCLRTGNLYIEYECKRQAGWMKSGISTTTADTWAFVIFDVLLAIPTGTLRTVAREAFRAGLTSQESDGSHPTKGVLLSLNALWLDLCERALPPDIRAKRSYDARPFTSPWDEMSFEEFEKETGL